MNKSLETESKTGKGGQNGEDKKDDMLEQAAFTFVEAGQASTSLIQRRLRLGYGRAARIIDELEDLGICLLYTSFAINIVLLLMIVSIYLATNAAMLQNVFAQVGQSPIYKGNSDGIAFLLSAQGQKEEVVNAAKTGKENGVVFTIAVTADQLEKDPEAIHAIEEMGHEIILQGMIDTRKSSGEEIRKQLHEEMQCLSLIHILTGDLATCLMLALSTDTGHFGFRNTTPRTLQMAAQLLDCLLYTSRCV